MSSARKAFTLLEMSVSVSVFALLMTMVGQSLTMGASMQTSVSASAEITESADRVLYKIASNLRAADYNWIYLNEGPVSTYSFNLCTGLSATGPVFGHQYTVAFDSVAGRLTGTLVDVDSMKILKEDIADGLRPGTGFQIGQLGQDVLVKGNQLQLTVIMEHELPNGHVIEKQSSTTIFLRSTIYANANLTTTQTTVLQTPSNVVADPAPTDPGTGPTEDPNNSPAPAAKPLVALGDDTDTSSKKIKIDGNWVYPNYFIIKGTINMPSQSTDAVSGYTVSVDKASDGNQATYQLTQGPTPNKSLQAGEFSLTGWVQGGMTVTVSASSASGGMTTVTKSY